MGSSSFKTIQKKLINSMSLFWLTRILWKYSIFKTKPLQIFFIQNTKFTKLFLQKMWGQSLDTHKMFFQTFRPKSYDYHGYINVWYYTFFFRPFDHSWFFHWSDEMKNQNDFPQWFQELWLFFCTIKDIFCPQILE